ncbi:hypothetical protein AB0L65_59345 [Nonomuraea sp. NPDC052116]|uniref:hypothetical protein n=1 Tax=Nonomuraea sp. NPDC052116 TaxID=3155665 RepID=UPI003425EB8C
MTRFPTTDHLASWARFAPRRRNQPTARKAGAPPATAPPTGPGVLGEAGVSAGKTNTFLGKRHRRIARRRSKKRAIVAAGRSILTVIWHPLSDPDAHVIDLGADFYDTRICPERKRRNHVRQLDALGYWVILEPAA